MRDFRAAQINLAHMLIGLHMLHGPFANDGPLGQHRHDVGNLPDEVHVMLDHHDGLFFGQRHQQLPGLLGFLIAHPGHGFVHEEQGGLLQDHHADLKPLFLAVRQGAGARMRVLGQPDGLQHLADPLPFRRRGFPHEGREHALARPLHREVQVLPHREVAVDRGGLELPADAELGDVLGVLADQTDAVAEEDCPGGWGGLAANDIQQGGLARAVGPDHHAQLVVVDTEIAVVQRLETVVIDDDVFAGKNPVAVGHAAVPPSALLTGAEGAFRRSRTFRSIPMRPSGNMVTTITKRPPKMNGQASGK